MGLGSSLETPTKIQAGWRGAAQQAKPDPTLPSADYERMGESA